MSSQGGDIEAARTLSSHEPVATRSGPPSIPLSNNITEAKIHGRWYSPLAARISGVHAPPTLRDRVTHWFPGLVNPSPPGRYPRRATDPSTDQVGKETSNPWMGSIILTGIAGSIWLVRHRLAITQTPFGAILVHKSTKKPISSVLGSPIISATPTVPAGQSSDTFSTSAVVESTTKSQLAKRVPLSVPLALMRDPRFVQGDTAVTLEGAINHWYRRHRALAVIAGVAAFFAVVNVVLAPPSQRVVAVGQLGEPRR